MYKAIYIPIYIPKYKEISWQLSKCSSIVHFGREIIREPPRAREIVSLSGDEIRILIHRSQQRSRGSASEEKRPSQRMDSVRFLSDVGKEECEMYAAHPSFDSRSSYHLALLRRLFRLLSLISEISVGHQAGALGRRRMTFDDGRSACPRENRFLPIAQLPPPRMIYLRASLTKIRPESKTIPAGWFILHIERRASFELHRDSP